jgi:multiple sugar transport system ATP-binding protein
MGSTINLYLDIGAEESIIAVVDINSTAEVGDEMEFAFDLNKMHIFDAETEEAII